MAERPRAIVSWSSGKDSAYALHMVRQSGSFEVTGLLTTVTAAFDRVSMHGVRRVLLEAQAQAAGLPLIAIEIPDPCPNEVYERKMAEALAVVRDDGVGHVIFGDLFLEEIRAYREAQLERVGMAGAFPLWARDTAALAREMIGSGMSAHITCVDPKQLDAAFAGRSFDEGFLEDLPEGVDPCGENGEFHSFCSNGPMFDRPIPCAPGKVVTRAGFVFADLVPG